MRKADPLAVFSGIGLIWCAVALAVIAVGSFIYGAWHWLRYGELPGLTVYKALCLIANVCDSLVTGWVGIDMALNSWSLFWVASGLAWLIGLLGAYLVSDVRE